jgi:hypothetical protein
MSTEEYNKKQNFFQTDHEINVELHAPKVEPALLHLNSVHSELLHLYLEPKYLTFGFAHT